MRFHCNSLNQRAVTLWPIGIYTDEVHMPLTLKGTMSGFDTRKPTLDEVRDIIGVTCIHVHLTPTAPWDLQASLYGDVEERLRDNMLTPEMQLSPLQMRGLNMESAVEQETFDFSVPLATHPDVKALYHSSARDTSDQIAVENVPFQCDLPPNPVVLGMMMSRPPSCYIYSTDSL
jgi:hypothetical protein